MDVKERSHMGKLLLQFSETRKESLVLMLVLLTLNFNTAANIYLDDTSIVEI